MIIRLAAILFLATSLIGSADAGPKPGGGPHGGGPHGGGPHAGPPGGGPRGGGAPHVGAMRAAPHIGGGPRIGGAPRAGGAPHAARIAVPHAPRAMSHGGPRHFAPRHAAPRSFARAHAAPRARFAARPAFHGRPAIRATSHSRATARAATRAAIVGGALDRSGARDSRLSRRDSAGVTGSLRSAAVRAQDARRSAFAMRAFSGTTARAQAARLFGDPAFARRRADPAFFARVRFAGAFWPGPFFWPYAYYDDTFWLWPSAYDEAFWAYGYNDVLRGVYSPYAFADYDEFLEGIGRPVRRARGPAPPRNFGELCGEAAPGLTDWPVDRIVDAVAPNEEQRALLDALIRASDKAAEGLRAACPRSVAVTPIGRLDALEQQLASLQEAVRIVRPALEKFYASLNDDQKQRFNALAPAARPARRSRSRAVAMPQPDRLARACQETASADWPVDRIEDAVRPSERQLAALQELRSATTQAGRIVQAACPTDLPLTPTGRLATMEGRVDVLRQGAATLRPALAKFYATLNDEQKARLNRALGSARRTTG